MKFNNSLLVVGLLALTTIPTFAQQQYTATEEWTVGPGDYIPTDGVPGCGQHSFDLVGAAAQAIGAAHEGGVYGSLASIASTALQQLRPGMGGLAGQALDVLFGGERFANCVPVGVAIPMGAQITGITLESGDQTGTLPCISGQDCPIGWSRFDPPQILPAGQEVVVTSLFRNWSGDRTRTARLIVNFTY